MTCPRTTALIDSLVDDELSAPAASELRKHLATCATCRTHFEETSQLKELLSKVSTPAVDDDYWAETTDIILARTQSVEISTVTPIHVAQDRKAAFMRSLMSVAASLFILMTAIYVGNTDAPATTRSDSPGQLIGSIQMFQTPADVDPLIKMLADRKVTMAADLVPIGSLAMMRTIGLMTLEPSDDSGNE